MISSMRRAVSDRPLRPAFAAMRRRRVTSEFFVRLSGITLLRFMKCQPNALSVTMSILANFPPKTGV